MLDRLAVANFTNPSIKPGGKPTMGNSDETLVIVQALDCPCCLGNESPFELSATIRAKAIKV